MTHFDNLERRLHAIEVIEKQADKVTYMTVGILHKTFIMPCLANHHGRIKHHDNPPRFRYLLPYNAGMEMTQHQLDIADSVRRTVVSHTARSHKSEFGQFMTPSNVARFMVDMFPPPSQPICRLLDPGAGVGALSCAFLDRRAFGDYGFDVVEVTAYEIDEMLAPYLSQHLSAYTKVRNKVITGDYIERTIAGDESAQSYTHAILNPPYKKINSRSWHRRLLRTVGIETVNLYTAFVALAVSQAAIGGQIVAIVPRSFCNGPYHRPFREFILNHCAICHMHLFGSRKKTFRDDDVLQENIIIRLERGGRQGNVLVTTSTDDSFSDLVSHEHPFDRIVFPDDPENFIHVPTTLEQSILERSPVVNQLLANLEIQVSTGPVVDFRVKEHLCDMPVKSAVPLLYPAHLPTTGAVWPLPDFRKSNAIMRNEATEKWLYPNGFYCAVRRFSAKEEKRRVVASVVDPNAFVGHTALGFENHLNIFHADKQGLPESLARGLTVFLNSTAVDENFRRFSGHTQVNATDLRRMKYPNREVLTALGEWAKQHNVITQDMIDERIERLVV